MACGVFIHRFDSNYQDTPAERYHFPRQYLGRAQACVGDWVVYYEPRKVPGTRGYFAVARVGERSSIHAGKEGHGEAWRASERPIDAPNTFTPFTARSPRI